MAQVSMLRNPEAVFVYEDRNAEKRSNLNHRSAGGAYRKADFIFTQDGLIKNRYGDPRSAHHVFLLREANRTYIVCGTLVIKVKTSSW